MATLRIATWNAGHRKDTWELLPRLGADIVLAQELVQPPVSEQPRTIFEAYQDPGRPWGTGIWARELPLRRLPPSASRSDRSRSGTAAVAEIPLPNGGYLTAISVHAIDEYHDRLELGDGSQTGITKGFAVATMHRLLSDLTGYLTDHRRRGGRGHKLNRLVFGGDFNANPGWDERQGNRSHELVFARVAEFGLEPVLPVLADNTHETIVRDRVPFRQIDYLYTSTPSAASNPTVLRTPELERRGDHLPVLVDLG